MSHARPRLRDDRRRYSDASFSNGWSSNDDGTEISVEPTHPTDYSDDPMTFDHQYEYIDGDDTPTQEGRDAVYPDEQHTPYPNGGNMGDETMAEMAYHFMTGDRQADGYSGLRGSVEALPSTSPPQYVTQEPTTEFDQYRTINNSDEALRAGHHWGCGEDETNVANMTFQGQHTYGSGSHLLQHHDNASTGHHATVMVIQHNFPPRYPPRIDDNDLYGSERTMEVENTDWEMVDRYCVHDRWEQCPFCSSQRFASPRY
ncbi:hypothetical protein B0T21DRAFT_166127 [Apiosordaria backusii]|uniref:Uncharacterized protein n=1 Tax=Apiosordaria backusii TaxID=314023 RepID=A0AA40BNT1_9PEZI|nr:hypothetical protein B0T21DRAFT_166127 [Apiosordaria backusii]